MPDTPPEFLLEIYALIFAIRKRFGCRLHSATVGSEPMADKKRAAALKYTPSDAAPKVIAKGKGITAENILKKADEEYIPVYKDAKLAEELTQLDLDVNIPPDLYEVVAQVLVFISDLDTRAAGRPGGIG